MQKLVIGLYVFVYIIIGGCSHSSNSSERTNDYTFKLDSISDDVWKELDIRAEDSVFQDSKAIFFHIHFIDNYFLTDETNERIFQYLFFKAYSQIILKKELEQVHVKCSFNNLQDIMIRDFSLKKIKENQQIFNENELYKRLFVFLIKNLNTEELIEFDYILERINKANTENGLTFLGFWSFIDSYSENCCANDSLVHKKMSIIKHASEYPKAPHRPDIIRGLIEIGDEYCEKK